jgi:TonB family protein
MQLTKLRAAPVQQAEVPPCAPAGQSDGGTASQLIRSVRRLLGRNMRSRTVVALLLVDSALVCGLGSVLGCASRSRPLSPAEVPAPTLLELPRPKRDLADLEAALASESPDARAAAAWELAGAQAVPIAVLERLRSMTREDPEERVRLGAAWAYGHLELAVRGSGPSRAYDEAPRQLRITRPQPPADLHGSRTGGEVLLDILISERGEVALAVVRQSVEGLDDLALKAVRDWLFEPARAEGRPVSCVALAPVSFRAYR